MKWLFDTVNSQWHLWDQNSPGPLDKSLCQLHLATPLVYTEGGDTAAVPVKCATCVTSGSNIGLPIT